MNKLHRIFIAINLPEEIKKALAKYEQKFLDLSRSRSDTGSSYEFDNSNSSGPALFKWVPEDNLHITLEFLGGLYDHELPKAIERAKEIAAKFKGPFDINLNHISYGPEAKIPPRMLWATAGKMHVTLAKINAFAWRQIEPAERPDVEEHIDLVFTVESIDVMESTMGKGGPKYTILESVQLT